MPMAKEKTTFKVPHLIPEVNMPITLAFEWILTTILEITKLDEEDDPAEMTFY